MSSRIAQLRRHMADRGLSALLVIKRENILYLSGFSGSSGALIVTDEREYLLSDFRYVLQAAQEAPEWTFIQAQRSLMTAVREALMDLASAEVGFDPDSLSVTQYQQLRGEEISLPYTLVPAAGLVEELRLVKDPDEIARIRDAVRITDDAYQHLVNIVRPGITEHELALEVEWHMRSHGAEAMAFDVIVAAGEHSALPHAQPGARAVQPGDLVVVDMGARYARYCADMTRTFAVGHATAVAQEIYRVCLQAQLAGLARITAGMTGREADGVVRDVIDLAGYGDYYGHGTGHGVGLEIHESPRVSQMNPDPLPAGTVITVEPGIYLPDVGGVRIEDLTVLTENGLEVLTSAPKPDDLPVYG